MNARERFIRALKFQPVDRIPLVEWGIREATLREWYKQGLPPGLSAETYADLDPYPIALPLNLGHYPPFEEKILEETDEYKIWIDKEGALRKDFKEIKTPGFVTRTWLKFPVEKREDFLEMKKRYNSKSPERYPSNWDSLSKFYKEILAPVCVVVPFLFWTIRQWMGFHNMCLTFYDDPRWMEEMMEFVRDFLIDCLERALSTTKVDIAILSEDMAFKGRPMISPEMFKRFMMPHYKKFVEFLREKGVELVIVDSDGYPGPLIKCWLDAGVDGFSPVEIAAGNDPLELRKAYGKDLRMLGGIDKRALAKGRKEIYEEVTKVTTLIEKGGYIPHVDHAIPPDVPLENFLYYRRLLSGVAYGENLEPP